MCTCMYAYIYMYIPCPSYTSNSRVMVLRPNPKPPADSNNCHYKLCSVIQLNNQQKQFQNISSGVSSFL